MSKRSGKTRKAKSVHDAYELSAELDFSKLKFVGLSAASLEKYVARRQKPVMLDPDVARVFGTSESVNTVLRSIIKGLSAAGKRKKSA